MTQEPALSRPVAAALAAIAVAAIAVSLYLALAVQSEATSGASTYSRSALGHSALLEVLRRRGVDATASRGASRQKLHGQGLLILAEPDFDPSPEALKGLLRSRRVLLVLPKWTQDGEADRRGWIALALPKPLSLPQSILETPLPNAQVIRPDGALAVTTDQIGGAASVHLDQPVQLIAPDALRTIVGGKDGALLGHAIVRGHDLWVLSDPDVISNHGLAAGNAPLAVAIIDRARDGGPVIFDETIHGFSAVPSGQFRLLAARPFAAATLSAVLAVACVVWATARRFGAAPAAPEGIAAGRLALIANIADLLVFAGHLGHLLRRYVQVSIEDVAARLHAPDTGDTAARADWLAQAEAQRGATRHEAALRAQAAALAAARRAPPAAAFHLARDIYAWKQEMLRGA